MAWDVILARFMPKDENRKNKYKYYHKMANKQVKGVEAVSYTHLTLPTTPYV